MFARALRAALLAALFSCTPNFALAQPCPLPQGTFTLKRILWGNKTRLETWTLRYMNEKDYQADQSLYAYDGITEPDGFTPRLVLIDPHQDKEKEQVTVLHELLHVAFGSYPAAFDIGARYEEHDFIVPTSQVLFSILQRNPLIAKYLSCSLTSRDK